MEFKQGTSGWLEKCDLFQNCVERGGVISANSSTIKSINQWLPMNYNFQIQINCQIIFINLSSYLQIPYLNRNLDIESSSKSKNGFHIQPSMKTWLNKICYNFAFNSFRHPVFLLFSDSFVIFSFLMRIHLFILIFFIYKYIIYLYLIFLKIGILLYRSLFLWWSQTNEKTIKKLCKINNNFYFLLFIYEQIQTRYSSFVLNSISIKINI